MRCNEWFGCCSILTFCKSFPCIPEKFLSRAYDVQPQAITHSLTVYIDSSFLICLWMRLTWISSCYRLKERPFKLLPIVLRVLVRYIAIIFDILREEKLQWYCFLCWHIMCDNIAFWVFLEQWGRIHRRSALIGSATTCWPLCKSLEWRSTIWKRAGNLSCNKMAHYIESKDSFVFI